MADPDDDLYAIRDAALLCDDAAERELRFRHFWSAWEFRLWWGKTKPLPTFEEWSSSRS